MLNKNSVNFVNTLSLNSSIIRFNTNNPTPIHISLNKNFSKTNPSLNKPSYSNHILFNKTKLTKVKYNSFTSSQSTLLHKNEIHSLNLIGQFDHKFLILLRPHDNSILILDQHAIHERILYEYYSDLLYSELYSQTKQYNQLSNNNVKLNLFEVIYGKFNLKQKIRFKADLFHINLSNFASKFTSSKIHNLFYFTFSFDENGYITLYSVPIIFDKIHKCESLLSIFANLINNLNYYIEQYTHKTKQFLSLFDSKIRSKACRNAIKFNDVLDNEYMKTLIKCMSECKNPFLCAHGRHNFFLINPLV